MISYQGLRNSAPQTIQNMGLRYRFSSMLWAAGLAKEQCRLGVRFFDCSILGSPKSVSQTLERHTIQPWCRKEVYGWPGWAGGETEKRGKHEAVVSRASRKTQFCNYADLSGAFCKTCCFNFRLCWGERHLESSRRCWLQTREEGGRLQWCSPACPSCYGNIWSEVQEQ